MIRKPGNAAADALAAAKAAARHREIKRISSAFNTNLNVFFYNFNNTPMTPPRTIHTSGCSFLQYLICMTPKEATQIKAPR